MPLFGRGGPRNPQELVKGLREALGILSTSEGGARKAEKVGEASRDSFRPLSLTPG